MQEIFANILQMIKSLQIGPKNILEMLILAYLLYHLLVWVKNTRTWFIFRGIVILLLFITLANVLNLSVITFLSDRIFNLLLTALLIIFAPDLRQALEQLGQSNKLMRLLNSGRGKTASGRYSTEVTSELVKAAFAMAKVRTGALMVIERELLLEEYIKTGIVLDARLSGALLINIFEKNTPLHDGAVIIRGNRVVAATCYLPLSDNPEINKEYGTRHRAAIGVSENSDSLTIVVSEETGDVSLAVSGKLLHGLSPEELTQQLTKLEAAPDSPMDSLKKAGKSFSFRKQRKEDQGKEETGCEEESL